MSGFRDFAIWLLARQDRDDPIGDLAKDFASDVRARDMRGELPYRTLADFRLHVSAYGCSEAQCALREAHAEYRDGPKRCGRKAIP